MKWLILGLLLVGLGGAACAGPAGSEQTEGENNSPVAPVEATPTLPPLPIIGAAPTWENEVWINNDQRPVRLEELRGKVILLEFWTFGCINCQRVLPYLNEWYDRYDGSEFTIISIHYPEFGYEEVYDNVVAAVEKQGIEYPVGLDNDGRTWRAYGQRYWPTRYLIDKAGNIRYKHIGERAYEETEQYIQQLMAEPAPSP